MDTNYSQNRIMDSLDKVHHVLITEEATSNKEIILNATTYSIGRHSSNDIVLSCQKTSRHHATLLRRTDAKTNQYSYWILDGDLQGNRSRNGIYVNGKKTLVHELKHGDVVQFSTDALAKYKITSIASSLESQPSNWSSVNQDIKQSVANNDSLEKEIVQPDREGDIKEPARQNSFAELSPQSIIETDLYGNIVYINSAGIINFKDLYHRKLNHPLLENLIAQYHQGDNIIVRDIQFENKLYQQTAYYLPEKKVIRSYVTDISQYRAYNKQLHQNHALYQKITQQINEGIIVIESATKQIIEANAACSDLLGYSNEQLLQMNIYEVVGELEKFAIILRKIIAEKNSFWGECIFRSREDNLIDASVKIDLSGTEPNEKIYIIIHNLATRKHPLKTEQNSSTDRSNRKIFNQQLSTAIANAKRNQKLLAVMFCQLNLLPDIRNSIGAEQSDRLLTTLGERLNACLRSGDPAIRWQEDKFALLLPQVNDLEEVVKINQRIRQSIQQSYTLGKNQITIDCKTGITIYPQDGTDVEILLANANTALERAVKMKDSYQFYDEAMNSQALVALELENLLEQALQREEFELYYQPQIDVNNGNINSVEALIRWQHPELGLVAPGNFIRTAEKTKLIVPIGDWTIRVASMQNQEWQAQGLTLSKVTISLSLVQFQQPNLAQKIDKILSETGLDASFLELEIGAVSLMDNIAYSRHTLEQLKSIGVKIAVDGFTWGFSAVEYLRYFALDTLKIDRHLVDRLSNSPQDLAIVTALIELGKGFGLRIVAEGVENQEQVDLLRSLGCNLMQGFWFGRPLAAKEAGKLLQLDNVEEADNSQDESQTIEQVQAAVDNSN
jgi:diguanylate cyclase (GGDEF)-like protein/PAS domain S-box-containing protein